MAVDTKPRLQERLCSKLSRANKEDVGGTAPTWERCLVVELPKPWEGDVIETSHLPEGVADVLQRAEERGQETRLQCVAPDGDYSVEGHTRVMLFSRPSGPFTSYVKDEFVVPVEQVGLLAEALLEDHDRLLGFEGYRQDASRVRDFFVCTHGTRDVCCGSFGYPIYHKLRHDYAVGSGGNIRAWRVSHIGGHRLSPNVVDMPEGRFWARVRTDELPQIVGRTGPVSGLARFYRGWAGMGSPFEQVVEREAFAREGWAWTSLPKSGTLVSVDDGGAEAHVRIDFSDPDSGASGAYEATVEHSARGVASTGCLVAGEAGEVHDYRLSHFERVD